MGKQAPRAKVIVWQFVCHLIIAYGFQDCFPQNTGYGYEILFIQLRSRDHLGLLLLYQSLVP